MRFDLTLLRNPRKRPLDWLTFPFPLHKITLYHVDTCDTAVPNGDNCDTRGWRNW